MKTTLALALSALVLGAIPVLTPCATEDSTLCNWDSATRGNGKGSSFISLTDDWKVSY
jgi:hypothetical protein